MTAPPKALAQQTLHGEWHLVDGDESQSGGDEFQLHVSADNPPEQLLLRFKRLGPVSSSSWIGDRSIVVFEGVDGEFHLDLRELIAQKEQFQHDQLLDLNRFKK